MGPKYVDIEDLNLIQEEVSICFDFRSSNFQVADDYLFKSKLENFLVLAIREVIRGD